MSVTIQDQCWKLDSISCDHVPDLCCNHEEADARMILHMMHSGGTSVTHCDDTDVLVLLLSHRGSFERCYLKKRRGSKTRIIELALIAEKLVKQLAPGIHKQDFLRSLIGLHALTGCNTVSAFAGNGKLKALKLFLKNKSYVTAMMELGESWQLSDEMLSHLCVISMETNTKMLTSFIMSFTVLKVVKLSHRPCHHVGHQ